MNFASGEHYQAAVDAMLALGLPLREKLETQSQAATDGQASRPSTAPSAPVPSGPTPLPGIHAIGSQPSRPAVPEPWKAPNLPVLAHKPTPDFDLAPLNIQQPHAPTSGPSSFSAKATHSAGTAPAPNASDAPGAPLKEAPRGRTSDGKLEGTASTSDPLRRTLFPGASEKPRPVSAPGAPVSLETLTQMLPPPRALPFAPPKPSKPTTKPGAAPVEVHGRDQEAVSVQAAKMQTQLRGSAGSKVRRWPSHMAW